MTIFTTSVWTSQCKGWRIKLQNNRDRKRKVMGGEGREKQKERGKRRERGRKEEEKRQRNNIYDKIGNT